MRIPVHHPDAGHPLLDALGRALNGLGASVCIDAEGENLVRALRGADRVEIPPRHRHVGPPIVEVCAQGLPNLLHEFVHIVLAARLDDDHGIDYHAIPFDLTCVGGREVLFEELACCVLSCAYLSVDDEPATRCRVDAWFVEQVEIQPVFYGMEDNPQRFWQVVRSIVTRHQHQWSARLLEAYAGAHDLLRWGGATSALAQAPRHLDFIQLFERREALLSA